MALLLTFLGISKYFVIGVCAIFLLQNQGFVRKDLSTSFTAVFSFLVGILVSSTVLHIGLLSNTLSLAYPTLWGLSTICLLLLVTTFKKNLVTSFSNVSKFWSIFLTFGYFGHSIMLAFQPVIANDARGIWLLKAKAMLQGSSAFFSYLQSPLYPYSHTDYPITMPLLYADLLKPLGSYWEPAIGILSFTFFFLLLIGIYGAIRQYAKLSNFSAFAITCVIFFTPEYLRQGWAGLSDVPLSLTFFGTILGLQLINQYTSPKVYLLPLAVAALGSTLKNEGQSFLLFTLVICLVVFLVHAVKTKYNYAKEWKGLLLPALLIALTLLPIGLWKITTMNLGIVNDVVGSPNLRELLTRIPTLINEITPRLFDAYRFGILFLPSLLLLAIPSKNSEKVNWTSIILLQALMYLMIYLVTPHNLTWHISTSFSRLLLHLLPSIYLLVLFHRSEKSIV